MSASLEDFRSRLVQHAAAAGWKASDAPLLVSDRFRGRELSEGGNLPLVKLGVQLGVYPVILAPLALSGEESVAAQVRALHSQVLIARSHLEARQIVDLHLFLLVNADELTPKQRADIDRIERDEAICRKQACVLAADTNVGFERFLERTFLARPWDAAKKRPRGGFRLDQPAGLVREILVKQGLTPAAADAWVRLADAYQAQPERDPTTLIDELVHAMVSENE